MYTTLGAVPLKLSDVGLAVTVNPGVGGIFLKSVPVSVIGNAVSSSVETACGSAIGVVQQKDSTS